MTHREKYPEGYFFHFLEMFADNYQDRKGNPEVNEENISDQILMLIHIDGDKEYLLLKDELRHIVEANDVKLFKGKKYRSEDELTFIAERILKHH